ncbi:hypothetical protein [Actinomadura sp. NPDC049753]|uniref:hypothetical protein n=1 Tax=Actinomadura sp. NPDC049753 TaxID=3154739 RepID=UPI00341F9562
MPRNEQKLYEIARAHWCAPGERLVMGDHAAGHIGATVRGLSTAPAPSAVPDGSSVPDPSWPLPTDPVRTGRFWYDEWPDDPVIWGWAHAPGPDAAAAAVAGHMTGYADEAWLLLTDRRLAVSVESRFARPSGRPGGLRGRVRGARGDDSGDSAVPLTTCWEIPFAAVRGLRAVPLGRTPQPEWFIRIDFTDGSAFDFRPRRGAKAPEYVASVYSGLAPRP